jgi:hypothetical protein
MCYSKDMAAHKADPLPHIDFLIKTQRKELDEMRQQLEMSNKKHVESERELAALRLVPTKVSAIQKECDDMRELMRMELHCRDSLFASIFPIMLQPTIQEGRHTLHLACLSIQHFCDFCPVVQGKKQPIHKAFGKYFVYRAPGADDIDMCLSCAATRCTKTKEMLALMPSSLQTCVVEQAANKRGRFMTPEQAADSLASMPAVQVDAAVASSSQVGVPQLGSSRPAFGKPPKVMVPGFIYKITPFNAKMTAHKAKIVVQSHHMEIEGEKVRRGPNWRHANQDGDGIGVIIRRDLDCVFVSWQNGVQDERYYIDMNGEHHLMYA